MNNSINTLLNSLSNLGEIRKADKNNGEYSSISDNTMTVGTRRSVYKYFPTSKQQLREIIAKKILDEGYECNLNDIDISEAGDDLSALFSPRCLAGDVFWITQKIQKGINMYKFNGHIENWDVSNVKAMDYMFYRCSSFDQDISGWHVSNAIFMQGMFWNCQKFNQNLSNWDVSNVNDMCKMFEGCENFDQDISGWDISNVAHNGLMFNDCPIKEEYKPKFR